MKAGLLIRPGKDGRQSLGDERRTLTEDKDKNDDDQHVRDLFLRAPVLRPIGLTVVSTAA